MRTPLLTSFCLFLSLFCIAEAKSRTSKKCLGQPHPLQDDCAAHVAFFYFDQDSNTCKLTSGCRMGQNAFLTFEECGRTCSVDGSHPPALTADVPFASSPSKSRKHKKHGKKKARIPKNNATAPAARRTKISMLNLKPLSSTQGPAISTTIKVVTHSTAPTTTQLAAQVGTLYRSRTRCLEKLDENCHFAAPGEQFFAYHFNPETGTCQGVACKPQDTLRGKIASTKLYFELESCNKACVTPSSTTVPPPTTTEESTTPATAAEVTTGTTAEPDTEGLVTFPPVKVPTTETTDEPIAEDSTTEASAATTTSESTTLEQTEAPDSTTTDSLTTEATTSDPPMPTVITTETLETAAASTSDITDSTTSATSTESTSLEPTIFTTEAATTDRPQTSTTDEIPSTLETSTTESTTSEAADPTTKETTTAEPTDPTSVEPSTATAETTTSEATDSTPSTTAEATTTEITDSTTSDVDEFTTETTVVTNPTTSEASPNPSTGSPDSTTAEPSASTTTEAATPDAADSETNPPTTAPENLPDFCFTLPPPPDPNLHHRLWVFHPETGCQLYTGYSSTASAVDEYDNMFPSVIDCYSTCVSAHPRKNRCIIEMATPDNDSGEFMYFQELGVCASIFEEKARVPSTNKSKYRTQYPTLLECKQHCDVKDISGTSLTCRQEPAIEYSPFLESWGEQYYFDSQTGHCVSPKHGNITGVNRFSSLEECFHACISTPLVPESCVYQPDRGPCLGNETRYYFDAELRKCQAFEYGGCRGNTNNYETAVECENSCSAWIQDRLPEMDHDTCLDSEDPGAGGLNITRYFFNQETRLCQPFQFGGLGGTGNNFLTAQECWLGCQHSKPRASAGVEG